MRDAFYSGVAAMMEINEAIGGDEISEDRGLAILEAIDREMRAFADGRLKEVGLERRHQRRDPRRN